MILVRVSYKTIFHYVLFCHTRSPIIVSSQTDTATHQFGANGKLAVTYFEYLKMTTYTKINLATLAFTVAAACLLKAAGILSGDMSFTFGMACIYAPMIIGCRYIALDIAR